ncbi:MAG: protein kinase, partial [Verrucomicrobiota bacterium]
MKSRFEIGDSLGKGGVSEVFRAFDHQHGREVAVKRLLPLQETNLNEPQSNSLEREVHALSLLKHRNVVELYEVAEDSEGSFAVLELIDGESLHDVIYEGALTYPDFVSIAAQLLGALSAAEEIHLLHRD